VGFFVYKEDDGYRRSAKGGKVDRISPTHFAGNYCRLNVILAL